MNSDSQPTVKSSKLRSALVQRIRREVANPSLCDELVASVELREAALLECVNMLTSLVENNADAGLVETYPDPYGAINDSREVLGLPRIQWKPRSVPETTGDSNG